MTVDQVRDMIDTLSDQLAAILRERNIATDSAALPA